ELHANTLINQAVAIYQQIGQAEDKEDLLRRLSTMERLLKRAGLLFEEIPSNSLYLRYASSKQSELLSFVQKQIEKYGG
ncbi:MAG: hypothetical protein R3350_07385, partial [Saprospiraceae bacterium]|nr:hypothetical protein [Saprospiraceae bacterium]